jgi:hypothetical protein
MFRKFNLKNIKVSNLCLSSNHIRDDAKFINYIRVGQNLLNENKQKFFNEIGKYVDSNGVINGSALQDAWFKSLDANIFISHSHKDENEAKALAGWLKEELGITAFIDSCAWGYADDLLKSLDDRYCLNPTKQTYDYKKRNISTTHVHMMLATALSKMMDKTECLFFLNTPNSISLSDGLTDKTFSAWIYLELALSGILKEHLERQTTITETEFPGVSYDVDLSHFVALDTNDLFDWKTRVGDSKDAFSNLDKLYELPSKCKGVIND